MKPCIICTVTEVPLLHWADENDSPEFENIVIGIASPQSTLTDCLSWALYATRTSIFTCYFCSFHPPRWKDVCVCVYIYSIYIAYIWYFPCYLQRKVKIHVKHGAFWWRHSSYYQILTYFKVVVLSLPSMTSVISEYYNTAVRYTFNHNLVRFSSSLTILLLLLMFSNNWDVINPRVNDWRSVCVLIF